MICKISFKCVKRKKKISLPITKLIRDLKVSKNIVREGWN